MSRHDSIDGADHTEAFQLIFQVRALPDQAAYLCFRSFDLFRPAARQQQFEGPSALLEFLLPQSCCLFSQFEVLLRG